MAQAPPAEPGASQVWKTSPTSSITAWPEEEIALAIDLDVILGTGHNMLRCGR